MMFILLTACNVYLLGSFTAVITNLNPLASVPHASVTYFNVTKLVRVNIAPTDCFVFRHVKSDCNKKKIKKKFSPS